MPPLSGTFSAGFERPVRGPCRDRPLVSRQQTRTEVRFRPSLCENVVIDETPLLAEDNPVRVVEVFVNELDLGMLGFDGVDPAETGRPAYHPAVLLKPRRR